MLAGNRISRHLYRLGLPAVLVIVAVVVAGCGTTAEPSNGNADPAANEPSGGDIVSSPEITPTLAVEDPTTPTPVPTATPRPTATAVSGSGNQDAPDRPTITVEDQVIQNGQVMVEQVTSNGAGWIVILADAGGEPGAVLGYSPVASGENEDVAVEIDPAQATPTLHAMLHTDAGQAGTYEFPGPDGAVETDGQAVSLAFAVEGGQAPAATADPAATVNPHAGHGGGGSGSASTPAAEVTPSGEVLEGQVEVAMRNYQFSPSTITIRAGTTVTWVNQDEDIMHNVESDQEMWHSELFGAGESFSWTFDQPGTYPYHCHPHGNVNGVGMAGTVIVVP